MKRILVFTILLFIFPMITNAKVVKINAYVDPSVKGNVNEIIVSFESSTGEDGIVDYSLLSSNGFKAVINDFSDQDPVKFSYGTLVVNNTVDSVGRYNVELMNLTEKEGTYELTLKVTDSTVVTTTQVTNTNENEENNEEKKQNNNMIITYGIIAIVVIVILIALAIFGIKTMHASNLY